MESVKNLRIEYLRDFIKLAKCKSFSKVAQDLSISQSTLSHRISQLEAELDSIRLINRTTKTFELTVEGQIVLEHANRIITEFNDMVSDLSRYSNKITENIVITASTIPGSQILPSLFAKFKKEHPNVAFKILINNSLQSINYLMEEKVDFAAIGSFLEYDPQAFDYKVIGIDDLVFVSSPNHPLLKKGKQLELNDLIRYSLILREIGSGTRAVLEQQFPDIKKFNVELEINDNDSIITAVSKSQFLSVLSKSIAEKAREANLIEVLTLKGNELIARRELYLLKKNDQPKMSNLKNKFWDEFPIN